MSKSPDLKEIQIRFSTKKKIWELIGIGILFASVSCYVFISDDPSAIKHRTQVLYVLPSYVLIIIAYLIKIYKKKPVVILTPEFLWWEDRRKNFPLETRLKWKDVNFFKFHFKMYNNGIDVHVFNPEEFFDSRWLAKDQQKWALKNFGTPFTISCSGLEIDSDKLIKTLKEYHEAWKNLQPFKAATVL